MSSSSKGYVSRPSGGLVNLPSKEIDMRRFAILFLAALAALLCIPQIARAQEVAATTQLVGGNGGLVNLPGGGGVAITGVGSFKVGQELNAAGFVPISYTIGSSGRVTVLGVYGDFIVLTQITATGKVLYEGTLTAINPGTTQLISRWECVCHPGVTQEVVTDINGSMKPEWYQNKHDERLALALSRHPAKTQQ